MPPLCSTIPIRLRSSICLRAGSVPLEDLDRRRLARAVWAQQTEHLATLHRDVDPAHGLVLAVALGQAPHLDRGARVGYQ
jgi:hypothetical protein